MVGLAVDPNGRETLLNLSNEILEAVKVCGISGGVVTKIFDFLHYFPD